jgi:hypothetical protein
VVAEEEETVKEAEQNASQHKTVNNKSIIQLNK